MAELSTLEYEDTWYLFESVTKAGQKDRAI